MFCTVEVGERAVNRTRQLKFAPELVWKEPEERFRLAMEDIKGAKPAQNSRAFATSGGTATELAGAAAAQTAEGFVSSGGEDGGTGTASSNVGTEAVLASRAIPPSSLSNPDLAIPQPRHEQQQQQQVEAAPSALTVSVWRKGTMIGKRQDVLVGSATVPAEYIDHPPGDLWLPLANDAFSTNPVSATTTTAGERRQNGAPGLEAGNEGGNTHAFGAVSGDAHPGEDADNSTGTGRKARGVKSWGSGLFKRGRGRQKGGGSVRPDLSDAVMTGSVHLWLGKVRRRSLRGQQPGEGHVILRVHAATGLRKVQ